MRRNNYLLAVAMLSLYLCAQSMGADDNIQFDPDTMIRASDVRPGMTGIGKSVFRGVKVEEFTFKVVGTMEKMVLGKDIVLAQITGGPPIERNAGVIGGMSGSPCYIRGKLLGALAYGWGWQKEALCGITPIEDMLQSSWRFEGGQAALPTGRLIARSPVHFNGRTITGAVIHMPGSPLPQLDPHTIILRPVAPQITCSGIGPQTMKLVREMFAPLGLEPLAGPGNKTDPVAVELEPGSAVGVRLMQGDFDFSGIGTLTWRDGDRVLAFGHPMMQLGATNMPLCTGWIHEVMTSISRSSKIGAPMTDVGAMIHDNPWAIRGRLGEVPRTIPATLRIVDSSRNVTKTYNVRVCNQPDITARLLTMATMSAVEATFNTGYEGTARLHYKILGQKGDVIERSATFHFQQSAVFDLMTEIAFPMYMLEENRFRPQNIASLELTAELDEKDNRALIERVYAEETVARAGEPLHIHVVIRPDGGEPTERVVTLNVPIETPKGSLRLGVVSGDMAWMLRSRLRLLTPTFNDLSSLIDYFQKLEQSTDLAVIAALPGTGLMVGDTPMMRLPGFISSLITDSPRTDLGSGKAELSSIEKSPWVLAGMQYMALPTADREGAKGAQPAKSQPGIPPPPPSPEKTSVTTGVQPPGAIAPITHFWAADAFPEPLASSLRMRAAAEDIPSSPPADALKLLREAEEDNDKKPDEAKNGPEEPEKPDKDEEEKDKLTVRQPTIWTQTTAAEFLEGELKGLAVRSDGLVTLAPHVAKLDAIGEFYVSSATTDAAGNTYIGTGSEGRIYKLDKDDKLTLFCDLDGLIVTALIADENVGLLAATIPGGTIHRLTPDGEATIYCELPADYVWAIGRTAQGKLAACTGAAGKLYELLGPNEYRQLAAFAQAHVMCIAADETWTYLGTADQGVVYRLDADGRCTALFDAKDKDITAIVAAAGKQYPPGTIWVATAGSAGAVHQVAPDGRTTQVYSAKKTPGYALASLAGVLYVGTGDDGKLLCIAGKDHHSVVYDSDNASITCLQPVGGTRMYVGTANLAGLLRFDTAQPTTGSLESSVLDASHIATWGALHWQVKANGGATAELSTRSGSNSDPSDASWSTWTGPLLNGQPGEAGSPRARYLQYRLQLARTKPDAHVEVGSVSIAYLPANQPPKLKIKKPAENAVISDEYDIKWDASDPESDTLSTAVHFRRIGEKNWRLLTDDTDDESYEWDTSEVEGGRYQLRIAVSDKPSNPGHPMSHEVTLELLTIDNADPRIWVDTIETRGKNLVIGGVAADDLSSVVEVCYRCDDRWLGARALDGMYDGRNERFLIEMPLPKESAEVTLRARDAGGNHTTIIVKWPERKTVVPAG